MGCPRKTSNKAKLALAVLCSLLLFHCHGRSPGESALFDFESDSELDEFYWDCHTRFSLSDAHPTHGSRSLKLELYPSDYPGLAPMLHESSWVNYRELCFDIYNAQTGTVPVSVRIDDRAESPDYADRYNRSFALRPGANHISIPLDSLFTSGSGRRLDPDRICRFLVFADHPKGKIVLYVDYIRLTDFSCTSAFNNKERGGKGTHMKKDMKIDILRKIDLFSSLTQDELQKLLKDISIENFRKNQTILYEENTSEFMYIILEGSVKAVQRTEEGKEMVLAIHRAGDFFGEMSLIDNQTTPATVVAKEDSTIALVSKDIFYTSIVKQNKVLEKLLRILCSRLRESWKTVQMLSFNNAAQRIKCLLLMLSGKYGKKTGDRITLTIKLTHQDLAEMTGMARETVTRVIDELQKSGDIVILKDKSISLSPDFSKELEYTM